MVRNKAKQRQKKTKKKPLALADIERLKRHTIPQFCLLYNVKRSRFYELQKRGEGPDITKEGKLTLITAEAGQRWSLWREQETQQMRMATTPEHITT
jgi:hypothetical protein